MALLPTPQSGRLLRWKADGTLENVTLAELLDQVAGQTQPDAATQKYWVDTSAALGANVNATAGAMLMAGYSPEVAAQIIAAITAGGASMALTAAVPGVATTTVSQFAVTLAGASMAMASGTPAVTATAAIQLAGASMAMSAGTTTVSNVTTFAVTLTGASMAVTGATPEVVGGSASGIAVVGTSTSGYRNTSGTETITLPSGIQQNDCIVIFESSALAGNISGYTRDFQATSTAGCYWKFAGSSESNPTLSSWSGSWVCIALRGVATGGDPFDTATHRGDTVTGSSASQAITGITTNTNGAMLLVVGRGSDGGWDDGESNGPNTAVDWAAASGAATTLQAKATGFLAYNSRYAFGLWSAIRATAGATGTTTLTMTVTEEWPGYSVGQGVSGLCVAIKPA